MDLPKNLPAKDPLGTSPLAVIVMGVSGCGKTSVGEGLAARFQLPFMEGDELHPAANVAKMASGIPLSDKDRWPWLAIIGAEIRQSIDAGQGIIVSCSALKKIYRERLRETAGGRLVFVFLEGSHALLAKRMEARKGHFMPASLLESQLQTLENPSGELGVVTVHIDGGVDGIVNSAAHALRDFFNP